MLQKCKPGETKCKMNEWKARMNISIINPELFMSI